VCEGVELPRLERHKVQPLTEEQAHMLLQKAKEYHLEALLTLALATGMRRGEILGLKWRDVDLEKGVLWIRCTVNYVARHGFVEGKPKTVSSDREIMLPQFVIDVLRQHRVAQLETRLKVGVAWIDRDLVFPGKGGDFMGPSTLLYHFSRLLREAGLPRIRFHDLRHSAATLLLSMGVSMKVVQELLGHSNFSTTANVYSHVLSSMQREAVEKMDGFLRWQQS
jgi:integrase